jgi:hypothetical protein
MGLALVEDNSSVSEPNSERKKPTDLEVQSQQPRSETARVGVLKTKLKSLLAKYDGSTKHPDVTEVVNELAELNPSQNNCASLSSFLGEFYALTCPNFPGRIIPEKGMEDLVQYSLGRLSFNIFQPQKLVCTLRSVRNPVTSRQGVEGKEDQKTFSYPLILDVTIHSPEGDLPAVLVNEAYCYEHAEVNNRLMVAFTGGTLMPADEMKNDLSKLKLWAKTFEGAYEKADTERSYVGRIFQFIIKLLLGLTIPTDDSLLKHSFHFDMKRSPVGYLDVLYLDDDLRITRGNRGTIVVVERSNKSVPTAQ